MRRVSVLIITLAAGLLFVPIAARAADNGDVNGTVTAAAPCMTLDKTSVDFGTHPFNTATSNNFGDGGSTVVTNCSGANESILGKVSNATSGQTTWTPVATNPCSGTPVTNEFNYFLQETVGNVTQGYALSGTDQSLGTVSANSQQSFDHQFFMPCVGSSGAGLTFSTMMTFTVTF